MKNLSLIINIVSYLILFFLVFIKVTDEKKRKPIEKLSLVLLMLWSLFLTAYLTETFLNNIDKPLNVALNSYEIITHILIIVFLITKIKDDKIFRKNDKV